MLVLVFDTETTGLPKTKVMNPEMFHLWPHIVQLSYIIYDTENNEIIKIRDFIIKLSSGILIPDDSIQIHGITNEMSQTSGVDIVDVFESFFKDIQDVKFVIGHNVEFDSNIVKVELLRLIYEKDKYEKHIRASFKEMLYNATYIIHFRCTMRETIEFCNIVTLNKKGEEYKKFPSLLELYEKMYNKKPQNLHNSLNDSLITLICFMKFNYNIDIPNKCVEIKNLLKKMFILK
jgi:DNA polymerase III epsilon subunit-like protein